MENPFTGTEKVSWNSAGILGYMRVESDLEASGLRQPFGQFDEFRPFANILRHIVGVGALIERLGVQVMDDV